MGGAEVLVLLIPLVLIWLLILRPAQRRQRQALALRESLTVGDDIVTTSGLLGTITEITDVDIAVAVAPGVEIRMVKGAVGQVKRPEPDTESDPEATTESGPTDEPTARPE